MSQGAWCGNGRGPAAEGVGTVRRVDLGEKRRRSRPRLRVAVVTTPLDELHTVEVVGQAGVRRVEHGDATTYVGDPFPHRRFGAVAGTVGTDPYRLVRSAAHLARAEELMARRRRSRMDRHPVAADEKAQRSECLLYRRGLEKIARASAWSRRRRTAARCRGRTRRARRRASACLASEPAPTPR